MSKNTTCILVSSCEKYRDLATWTARRIEAAWDGHPPLYFSGLHSDDPRFLRHHCDSRDWMTVTLEAVEALLREGFSRAYLVLDDIPPVGRCHADFLNHILPEAADLADATLVSLLGWGQHRRREGRVSTAAGVVFEQVPPANKWRFSLHPGLWNLADLREILVLRCGRFSAADRTPWNFERHQDDDFERLPKRILESCFRIHGRSHVNERAPWAADLLQAGTCFVIDVLLFLTRILRGNAAREKAAARWLWPYCLYRGPYPLFWSGVMRQGAESREWHAFARFLAGSEAAREWRSVRENLHP